MTFSAGNGVGYDGDFRNTFGIVSHSAAVGTVKLLDLATESEYQIERQGTLFVAKYAMGHGVLRPECAIELASVTLLSVLGRSGFVPLPFTEYFLYL